VVGFNFISPSQITYDRCSSSNLNTKRSIGPGPSSSTYWTAAVAILHKV